MSVSLNLQALVEGGWEPSRILDYMQNTGVLVHTASSSSANIGTWNTTTSNHNTGTAVDYIMPVGRHMYDAIDDLLKKQYPLTEKEAFKEEQEDTDIGFLGRLTIVNKEKTNE